MAAGSTTATRTATTSRPAASLPAISGQDKGARSPTTTTDRAVAKPGRIKTSSQPGSAKPRMAAITSSAESKVEERGKDQPGSRQSTRPMAKIPLVPPERRRGSTTRHRPTIRSIQVLRPPDTERGTVASITAVRDTTLASTSSGPERRDPQPSATSTAAGIIMDLASGRTEAIPAIPFAAPTRVLTLPLPPFAAAMPPRVVPQVIPSPAPPAYVQQKGWVSRPRIPLAVPIQLPDGTCISVPMSAIRHNRKWQARTATGRWILRFAADGRLTMCRKISETLT
ncbi:hypothetical protein PUN28_011873 [Cardiocondyla obscurior]|uniref:Uncharacterized protein n=1 Tax=Cardiocondyla obscurior TaxID=286306 RepID=A0AAW2FH90_9HYME